MRRIEDIILLVILAFVFVCIYLVGTGRAQPDTPRVWLAPVLDNVYADLLPGSDLAQSAAYLYEKGVFLDTETLGPWEPVSRADLVTYARRLGWDYLPQWRGDTMHITRLEFADRYGGFAWDRSPWHHDPYDKLRKGQLAQLLYHYREVDWRPMRLTGKAGMKPPVEIAWRLANYSIPGLRFLGSYARSGHVRNSDHYTGMAFDAGAFDVGGSNVAMHRLRDWLLENWGVLHLKYVIHDRVIYFPEPQWYRGPNPHTGHVHSSFWR